MKSSTNEATKESIKTVLKMADSYSEHELEEAFEILDKEKRGYISTNELKKLLLNLEEELSDQEINEILREADHNCDGKVDYRQFIRMMNDANSIIYRRLSTFF